MSHFSLIEPHLYIRINEISDFSDYINCQANGEGIDCVLEPTKAGHFFLHENDTGSRRFGRHVEIHSRPVVDNEFNYHNELVQGGFIEGAKSAHLTKARSFKVLS